MEMRYGKSDALLMRTLDRFVQLRSVWLAVILCFGVAIPAYAATIFSEDYEVATVNDLVAKGWGVDGFSTDIVATPVRPGGGAKVLRQTYAGVHVNDNSNSKIHRSFAAQPEIWGRYFVRYAPIDANQPSGFTAITGKQHYLKIGETTFDGTPSFVLNHFWGSREVTFGVQEAADCNRIQDGGQGCGNTYPNMASVPLLNNQWYCTEYHIKMNTLNVPDGVMEIWVDGVLTFRNAGRTFRDTAHANAAFTNVEVYRQGSDNMYRYEDDFVMATTRVGCSGSPSADTTPPMSPTGLFVR